MRGEFSFIYVNIWYDVAKSKLILKNGSLKSFGFFAYFCGLYKNICWL